LLRKWVKEVQSAPNGFTILMGDTTDAFRTHARKHLSGYTEDENSMEAIDEWHKAEVRDLAKELEPIKGRIAGVILGNHYAQYMDGTNSEQYLCQLLGLRYLGPVGFIRLDFRDKRQVRHHLTIFAHHHGGSQGGRTTGGDVNALTRAESGFEADIYALSHTHRRYAVREVLLGITSKGSPRPVERPKVLIRTGAFLKGFGEDTPSTTQRHAPSYAEQKALRPTDLGWVRCSIYVRHADHKGDMTHRTRRKLGLSATAPTKADINVAF